MTVRDEARVTWSWPAWAGDVDHLQRLARILDDLIDSKRQQALRALSTPMNQLQGEDLALVAKWQSERESDDPGALEEQIKRNMGSSPDDPKSRWRTEVTATEQDLARTRSGRPEDVIAAVDPPFVKRLSISAPSRRNLTVHAEISFSDSKGCTLNVEGEDVEWVRGASNALATEIEKHVPWWTWLRTDAGGTLYFVLTALAIGAWFILHSEPDRFNPVWPDILVLGSMIGLGSGAVGATLMLATAKTILPAFEIVTPQTPSRGSRALLFLGGIATSVTVSVVSGLIG